MRLKIQTGHNIKHTDLNNIIGKSIETTIGYDFVEIPDTLSVSDIQKIKDALYSDETTFNSMKTEQKISYLAKKIGIIP